MDSIKVNGSEILLEASMTLESFLVSQKLIPTSVCVELNKEPVSPSEYANIQIHAGDSLEIVRVVAGG